MYKQLLASIITLTFITSPTALSSDELTESQERGNNPTTSGNQFYPATPLGIVTIELPNGQLKEFDGLLLNTPNGAYLLCVGNIYQLDRTEEGFEIQAELTQRNHSCPQPYDNSGESQPSLGEEPTYRTAPERPQRHHREPRYPRVIEAGR